MLLAAFAQILLTWQSPRVYSKFPSLAFCQNSGNENEQTNPKITSHQTLAILAEYRASYSREALLNRDRTPEQTKQSDPEEINQRLKEKEGVKVQCDHILEKLKAFSNPRAVEGMARYGINPENTYGVSIPNLRKMAKEIGVDHDLAQQLWSSAVHEARILAGMIDDPKMATEEQIERWVRDFDSWDTCDQCCMNLFEKTELAWQKAVEWSANDREFVKRAGFVLMARLAVSDKKADDILFESFLPIIKRDACDNRNYVKKAVNWALRQIGKRNPYLNRKAVEAAREIQQMDSRSAKWIASDALRELTGKAVKERLRE